MRERAAAALNGSCCKCAGPVHYISLASVRCEPELCSHVHNEQPLVALAAPKCAGAPGIPCDTYLLIRVYNHSRCDVSSGAAGEFKRGAYYSLTWFTWLHATVWILTDS